MILRISRFQDAVRFATGKFARRVTGWPTWLKRLSAVCADLITVTLSALAVLTLSKQGSSLNLIGSHPEDSLIEALLVGLAFCAGLSSRRLYSSVVRSFSLHHVLLLGQAAVIALSLMTGIAAMSAQLTETWRILLLIGIVSANALVLERFIASRILSFRRREDARPSRNVLIYGAGAAGTQLATALNSEIRYRPRGFLDDNPELIGRLWCGLPIFSGENAADVARSQKCDRILLAIPSLPRIKRSVLLRRLNKIFRHVMVIPSLDELASGDAKLEDIRHVDVDDLLERDKVAADPELVGESILGRNILITGAGGTIGSELCRQAVQYGAKSIVLLEMCEFLLYQIERELLSQLRELSAEQQQPLPRILPVLGSVLDRRLLDETIQLHEIHTVYHAAAYKHVPLVEANPLVAIRNNVIGTLNTVDAAIAGQCKRFVLVSTDKAVRPIGVMGASKRIAELVVAGRAASIRQGSASAKDSRTALAIVRFGNVLESSGSVIPLFRDQIRSGGPVTVTDPKITRFFMTIDEAVSLVIQAGSLGTGGEVFLLDMGDPVKIDSLARMLIRLSGLSIRDANRPDGDIEIVYTGLRPGEKLFEELLVAGASERTVHPKIFKSSDCDDPSGKFWERFDSFRANIDSGCTRSVLVELSTLASMDKKNDAPKLDASPQAIEKKPDSEDTSRLSEVDRPKLLETKLATH